MKWVKICLHQASTYLCLVHVIQFDEIARHEYIKDNLFFQIIFIFAFDMNLIQLRNFPAIIFVASYLIHNFVELDGFSIFQNIFYGEIYAS